MKTTTHAAATTLDDYVEIPDEQPKVNTSRVIALGENSVEIDVDASSASAPKITFYSSDGPVSLERVLQLVDSFDLSITDQRTVTLARRDGLICFVHQFSTSARIIDGDNVHDHIESRLVNATIGSSPNTRSLMLIPTSTCSTRIRALSSSTNLLRCQCMPVADIIATRWNIC